MGHQAAISQCNHDYVHELWSCGNYAWLFRFCFFPSFVLVPASKQISELWVEALKFLAWNVLDENRNKTKET